MKAKIPKSILVDTCFWFAVYDSRDQYHKVATKIFDEIQDARIIIPWPTLYEVLNTYFVKKQLWLMQFEKLLKTKNIIRLPDSEYKEIALEETFSKSLNKNWSISLVDNVIRQILSDDNVKIEYLVTFNEGDFIDLLRKKPSIELYNSR